MDSQQEWLWSHSCEPPAKRLPCEADHVLVAASAALTLDTVWKYWACVPNGCQLPLKPYTNVLLPWDFWSNQLFSFSFPKDFYLIVFKQSKAVSECQRSTHWQITCRSDQPERQSANWKRLPRKMKLLWPQIAFLNLMNIIFIKENRGANEKHSNVMIIGTAYWGLSCTIRSSNHFTFNRSFGQYPHNTILAIPISISKLGHGKAICLFRLGTAKKWPRQNLNPGHLAPEATLWNITQYCLYCHVYKK